MKLYWFYITYNFFYLIITLMQKKEQNKLVISYIWVNRDKENKDNEIPCTNVDQTDQKKGQGMYSVINNALLDESIKHIIYLDRLNDGQSYIDLNEISKYEFNDKNGKKNFKQQWQGTLPKNIEFRTVDSLFQEFQVALLKEQNQKKSVWQKNDKELNQANQSLLKSSNDIYLTEMEYGHPAFAGNILKCISLYVNGAFADFGVEFYSKTLETIKQNDTAHIGKICYKINKEINFYFAIEMMVIFYHSLSQKYYDTFVKMQKNTTNSEISRNIICEYGRIFKNEYNRISTKKKNSITELDNDIIKNFIIDNDIIKNFIIKAQEILYDNSIDDDSKKDENHKIQDQIYGGSMMLFERKTKSNQIATQKIINHNQGSHVLKTEDKTKIENVPQINQSEMKQGKIELNQDKINDLGLEEIEEKPIITQQEQQFQLNQSNAGSNFQKDNNNNKDKVIVFKKENHISKITEDVRDKIKCQKNNILILPNSNNANSKVNIQSNIDKNPVKQNIKNEQEKWGCQIF